MQTWPKKPSRNGLLQLDKTQPYFALALTFLQKYYKKAGVGTLMSLALPYTVSILIGWFLYFLIWYYAGIPLGPGSPMVYEL